MDFLDTLIKKREGKKLTKQEISVLGIIQLDRQLKYLKNRLNLLMEDIIKGNIVDVSPCIE